MPAAWHAGYSVRLLKIKASLLARRHPRKLFIGKNVISRLIVLQIMFCKLFSVLRSLLSLLKNHSLKGALGNQKWFYSTAMKTSFGTLCQRWMRRKYNSARQGLFGGLTKVFFFFFQGGFSVIASSLLVSSPNISHDALVISYGTYEFLKLYICHCMQHTSFNSHINQHFKKNISLMFLTVLSVVFVYIALSDMALILGLY